MSLSYRDAHAFVLNLLNYELTPPPGYSPQVISLERPRALMAALGNPQERYPVIHVAGTKGKGSVSALCFSALRAAGHKVGFYLSPHLQEFRERFRVDSSLIPEETFAAIVADMQPIIAQIPGITYWEVITAIGYEYFAREQVDLAVVEVGLGGRLDATNVITQPLVSVITSLSFDHTALLGATLPLIAREKAGIIKPGCSVVSAPQAPDALAVITQIAEERGAPLTVVGRDWDSALIEISPDGQTFAAWKSGEKAGQQSYRMPLLGAHQVINGTVALAALDLVAKAGFSVPDEAIQLGFEGVHWPGRFEIVQHDPLVILDSAHNAESAERLAQTFVQVYPNTPLTLVFGAFSDKDVPGMFRALLPIAARLIVMPARNLRAFSVDQLAAFAAQAGYTGPVSTARDGADALRIAREQSPPGSATLVTGSLSIVGEMRDTLALPVLHAVYFHTEAAPTAER